MKQCSKCGTIKDESEFYVRIQMKDGFRNECKICFGIIRKNRDIANPDYMKKYGKIYRSKNKEKIKTKNHKRYIENKEIININNAKWKQDNQEKIKEQGRLYRILNYEKELLRHAKYRQENKESINDGIKRWNKNNPDKVREKAQRASRKKRSTIVGKINSNISSAICRSLRNGKDGCHWEHIVGYTLYELMSHLEKQFINEMCWENYGSKNGQWNIDHKLPRSLFNYIDLNDIKFKQCWCLENLQPMWAIDNFKKGNRVA